MIAGLSVAHIVGMGGHVSVFYWLAWSAVRPDVHHDAAGPGRLVQGMRYGNDWINHRLREVRQAKLAWARLRSDGAMTWMLWHGLAYETVILPRHFF